VIAAVLALLLQGADDASADAALEAFKAAYKNPAGPARATAVADLARVPHEKTLKVLAPLLTSDVSTVRREAAKGLAGFKEFRKLALPALVGALGPNDKDPDVLEPLLGSIGKLGDESSLPAVHKACEHRDARVGKAAFAAAAELGSPRSVDFLIDQAKKLERHAQADGYGADDPAKARARDCLPACIKALQAITKEKHASAKDWEKWRKKGQG
jgi:HEAT repeat protein